MNHALDLLCLYEKNSRIYTNKKITVNNYSCSNFLIVILLAGSYYRHQQSLSSKLLTSYSPTPKPSAMVEYLTYTNERYGYTFQYPSTVSVEENIGQFGYYDADSQSELIILHNNNISSPIQAFGLEEEVLPAGESLMSYVKRTNYYQNGILTNSGEAYDIMPNRKIITLEEYTQDGKPAIKLVSQILPGQGSVEDVYYQAYIEHQPGRILSISDGLATYHPLEFDDQILASFRFFDPHPELDWVKHSFPESGFTFSLPQDWSITPSDLASFPEFTLQHDHWKIKGRFGGDGSFGQKAYLNDWKVRPDPRASYTLFSDYSKPDNYEVLSSIKTPYLFAMEAFIPLYNDQNLILSINDPSLELIFYRFLNSLSRIQ
jgi:hypothetical protein